MRKQHIKNQKGEIKFRKKLYLQQVERKMMFNDEFDAEGIKHILEERMEKTFSSMKLLREKDIVLSPYVEIGAERCQRSLIMENDLGADGAAVDISYDMLKSCKYYEDVFNKSKTPVRICCDANNLPFMSDSIPFVFCYDTLHHFPDPAPITEEIYRVLSPGGCFFFDEEPYKKILHINLYKGEKKYSKKSLNRSNMKKVLDYFFCEKSCNEVEHGILENEDLSLGLWKKALIIFDEKDVELISMEFLKTNLFIPNSYIKYITACLFGGGISGICRKYGSNVNKTNSLYEVVICPSCREIGSEELLNRENLLFSCPKCSKEYPVKDGILFLFSSSKFKELYPEVLGSNQ